MNKFFYLCLLSIVVLSYSVFAQDLVAYDDSLINGFTFNEWQNPAGTPCLVSQSYSAESASGTASLASNLNAWCTLFVYRSSAFKIDDYSYVEFDVFGFQPAGQAFTLSLVPNGWSFLGSGKAIGDYAAVAGYWQHVSIPLSDFGVAAGTSIAGISFRGSGGTYGNVLFDNIKFTKVASPAAPVISNGSPAGVLPNTTAEAPMNVTTDKDAVCKYDSSSGVSYALMSDTFDVTGGLLHQATLTNLTPGQQYIRYVKCQDLSGNANTQDYLVSFAVASSGSPLPTGTYRPLFIGNSFIGQTNNHLMSQDIAVAAGLDWVSTGDFTGYSNLKTMWDKASVQEKLAAGGYSHVIFEPFWWGEGITYENETVYAQKFVDAAVAMGAEPIMFSTHHANGWAESNWPAQDAIDAQYAQMAQAVGGIRIMPEADIWQEAYSRGYSGTFYGGSGHQNNAGGYITSLGFVRLLSGLDVVGNTAPPRNTPPASDVPSAADILLFQQVVNDMVPDMLVDVYPPLVSTHSPAKDSADVAADSNISVRISDFGVGVDSSTIEMSVNGNPVTPAVEGTPADYLVSYDPPSNLPRSSLITVEVAAQDLNGIAAQGNFSFNTVEGCLLTSAYWSSAALSAGGVVALTAEGNNCGGETVSFHVAEDDAGEGSSVAEPISVQPSDADFGSSAVSSWTAEYHPDNSGADDPPEYYFTAALLSEPGVAVNSTLLRVYNGSVPDGVPPAVLSTAPSGNLPSGTTQATLAATTDEVSECRHAASAGTGFNLMSLFSSTGSTSHSTLITGLIDGAAYAYYVKCRDLAGNVNADSLISFAVLSPNPIAIDLQVSASKDDAYHSPGGWPNYADNTNNIRAGRPSSTPVWGGWRWTGLNIPPGSVITDAYVEFNQLEWGYSSIPTTLAFENSSNAVTFSSGNSPAHRWSKRTAFQTQWNWSRQTPGSWIRTPSLAAGIQELAANGINDLVLLEDGTPSLPSQSHEWASYDYNPSLAARLHIEYISTGMPPVISNGQPAGSFPAGTSEVTVSANTNEIATCKYDNIGSTDYGLMANTFSATGNLSHSTQLNGLSQGTHNVYVRCKDLANNTNSNDYLISFSIDGPDLAAPLRSNGQPSGTLPAGTAQASMSLNTDESAVCRYGAPGVEFGLMANVFNVTGATAHSTQVTGLNDGSNNTFNVRCEDASGNNNTDDFLISFSIDAPDAEPPVASSISAVSDATAADVSWNTDEPSSSQVEYGLTDALGTFTSVDASLVASHSVTLVNLTPNTTYYYKVISQDGSGNSASAPAIPLAFTTAVQPSVLKQLDAYEDSFVNGFTYNEWQNPAGTPCLVAQSYTATSASGTASLATNLNNYCTLFLYRNAAFNVADYTHVEFDIYAVAPSLPGFSISLATQPWSTTGSSVQISSYVALGGSWQHVSIPLSAFAASGNIKGLYLRDGSSIGGNILFDNIRFVEKS